MLRLFLILSLTGIGSTAPLFGQEQLFPICENGRWGMVRENGAVVLEPLYDYIGYDNKGKKFIYYQSKKMGLIDQNGKVYSGPVYDNIFFPDTSWVSYRLGEKWNLFFETMEIFPPVYDSVVTLEKNVIGLVQGDSMQFFNMVSKSKTERWYTSGFSQGNHFFGYRKNDEYDLCRFDGMQVISEHIRSVLYAEDTLNVLTYPDGQVVFNNITGQFLGEKFESIVYSGGNFVGSKNGSGQLYVPGEKKSYTIPEVDAIISTHFPYLTFAKEDGVGVWNLASGKLIIPPVYDAVSRVNGAFFTRLDGYYGITGMDGTELLSPQFSAISTYDNLYLVEQDGLSGLFTKRGKKITDCIYNEIRVYDKNVKCFRGKELDMLSIDENGAITGKMTYTNYMSITFEQPTLPAQRSTSVNFSGSNSNDPDPLLNERYGWFQEVIDRQMGDTIKKVKGKWGLKFEDDSIAIKPTYGDVRVISGTHYSAAYTFKLFNLSKTEGMRKAISKRAYFQMGQVGTGFSRGYFRLVNHETKQALSKTTFQYVDYPNFKNYKLARAVTSVPVLINANGDVIYDNLTYFGNWDEDLLIICEGGTYSRSGSHGQTSPMTIESFLVSVGLACDSINYAQPWLLINGGKWSIIDKNGRRVNQEPYQYISPFNNNRSLVQKNNKWGVIDSTLKEIVPIIYQSVAEVYVKGERFFQVNNPVNNTYVYTRSTGSLVKTEIDAVKHYYNGRWFAHHINTNKWGLTDTALVPITGYEFDQVSAFHDGYAMVTRRGKRSVIDVNGNEYLEGYKAKEINYLGYDRFEIIQGNGSFVTDLSGDTLVLPGTCREVVHATEEFLIYLDKNKSYRLYHTYPKKKIPANSRIASFCLETGTVLLVKDGESRVYDIRSWKYITKALPGALSIGPNCYVFHQEGKYGIKNLAGEIVTEATFQGIEIQPGGWAFANTAKRNHRLLTTEGVYLDSVVYSRFEKKEDHYIVYAGKGVGLADLDGTILIPCRYSRIEKFNTGFYKAIITDSRGANKVELYDLKGNKVIPGFYQDIDGISDQALIVTQGGMDYLYTGFVNKSLSFQRITPVSSDIFILYEKKHYGMYNNQGENIIPVEYHNIVVDRNNFQVRFFNSFGYYLPDGHIVFDPIK